MDDEEISNNDSLESQFHSTWTEWQNVWHNGPAEVWICFFIKLFESFSIFAVDIIFILYLTTEFGLSDAEAGKIYSQSAIITLLTGIFVSGYIIDTFGVKFSLMVSSFMMIGVRFVAATTTDIFVIKVTLFVFQPIAISLLIPSMQLGIKQNCDGKMRALSFSIFYAMMVIGICVSGPFVDAVRAEMTEEDYQSEIIDGVKFTAFRFLILSGSVLNVVEFFMVTLIYRGTPRIVNEGAEAQRHIGLCETLGKVLTDSKFWKFMIFSITLIGVKIIFSLLFLIVPTILTREFGDNVQYGAVSSISPIFIVLFVFMFSPCIVNMDSYGLILTGSFLTMLSPIGLAFDINMYTGILFLVLLSLGEALSAPKIFEFAFDFTSDGKEGTFLALSMAPTYATMGITGWLGGYLLDKYYPETGEKRPWMLWIWIICMAAASTLILFVFRFYFDINLQKRKQQQQEQEALQQQLQDNQVDKHSD